jgi:arabinofuranosyltransferase
LKINGDSFIESVEKGLDNTTLHGDSIINYSEMDEVLGFSSYSMGPNTYIFHLMGLSDALISRLPRDKSAEDGWRVGHLLRKIPDGYRETLRTGINQIKDKNLASYYDKLSIIIRGDIFNRERLITIFEMNTGKYDYLIDRDYYSGEKH